MIERRYAALPGATAQSRLLVDAYGSMTNEGTIDAVEEDLYSVFRERAELMGWLTLWSMHEAELTGSTPIVGWGQVGLDQPRLVPSVLPAVLQCLSDSVRRFGASVSGFQVTAGELVNLSDKDCSWYLVHVLNWFNLDVNEKVKAVIHFDQGLLGDQDVSTLAACIEQVDNGVFEFKSVIPVPDEFRIDTTTSSLLDSTTPQPTQGLLVLLPEWTPSAVGWVLARVIDAAHTLGSKPSKYAVRISRVLT